MTLGLRARKQINDWTLTLAGERYTSSESWALGSGEESPALVKFYRFTIGLDYSFR